MVTDRKLRLTAVAHACGFTPNNLRNLIHREGFLVQGESDDTWRKFSPLDIAVLALMRSLMDCGLTGREANEISLAAIGKTKIMRSALKQGDPETFERAFVGSFALDLLIVWRDGAAWSFRVQREPEIATDAAIVIKIGPIVRGAFRRLEQAV